MNEIQEPWTDVNAEIILPTCKQSCVVRYLFWASRLINFKAENVCRLVWKEVAGEKKTNEIIDLLNYFFFLVCFSLDTICVCNKKRRSNNLERRMWRILYVK